VVLYYALQPYAAELGQLNTSSIICGHRP
jgi:hypothetical protein